MLYDTFFSVAGNISEISSGNYNLTVKLNPGHPIYKGHFPEMSVVPGVCTIQMIKECMEMIENKKLQYASILNCKFSAMITPVHIPELEINLAISKDSDYLLKATVKNESQTFLTLKANLK